MPLRRNQKKLVNSNAEMAAKNIELIMMLVEQTEKTWLVEQTEIVTNENALGKNVTKLVSGVHMI